LTRLVLIVLTTQRFYLIHFENTLNQLCACDHAGRRKWGRGVKSPHCILKILATKGDFLSFELYTKFHHFFCPSLENVWKNPPVAPWKNSFRRPCMRFFSFQPLRINYVYAILLILALAPLRLHIQNPLTFCIICNGRFVNLYLQHAFQQINFLRKEQLHY